MSVSLIGICCENTQPVDGKRRGKRSPFPAPLCPIRRESGSLSEVSLCGKGPGGRRQPSPEIVRRPRSRRQARSGRRTAYPEWIMDLSVSLVGIHFGSQEPVDGKKRGKRSPFPAPLCPMRREIDSLSKVRLCGKGSGGRRQPSPAFVSHHSPSSREGSFL